MTAGDRLNTKQVGGFVSICGLTISHLVFVRVVSIDAYKVRGSGHVSLDGPCKRLVLAARSIWPGNNGELARLVLG